MVSNRIMTAPITTATWAARVMLRPAVAAMNRPRPGKPARLVIGKRALRETENRRTCRALYKEKAFIKSNRPKKPARVPGRGRGVNAAPRGPGYGARGPRRPAAAGIKACRRLYHRRAWPPGRASVNSRPVDFRGRVSGNFPKVAQVTDRRRLSPYIRGVRRCLVVGSTLLRFFLVLKSGWSRWIRLISPSM